MRARLSVLLALLFSALPHAFAQTDQEPPTAVIVAEDFAPMSQSWQPVSGSWSVATGTYANIASGGPHISVITEYRGIRPAEAPSPELRFPEFFVRARVRNQGFNNTQQAGIVYGYQDARNYYEAVVTAQGHLLVRTVMNGIAVDVQPDFGTQTPCVRNTWCELEVRRTNGVTRVKLDGQEFFAPPLVLSQPEFTSGKVGLVTHSAAAQFDKVFIGVPFGDQAFLETFDGQPSVTFTPQSGQWSVVNGSYRNSAIVHTAVTLAPILTGARVGTGDTFDYTFRARMLNPYANTGNRVGIVFNYEGSRYSEVVFTPKGVAMLNLVENGVIARTLATANYGGTHHVAFEVELQNTADATSVFVNGSLLFDNIAEANPDIVPSGGVGLITHWAPGRFDNVQFDHGTFQPCKLTFPTPGPVPSFAAVSGTWDTNGGTLNSTAIGLSDIFNSHCAGNSFGEHAGTNEIYSARLLNEFDNSGNRVGLIYNYQDTESFYAGDYFEVMFSPTGIMQLNKFIEGVRYPVLTLSHNLPRETWFEVQVIRSGISTNIKVNGVTRVLQLPQGELRGGTVGATTRYAKGHFDNLSLQPRVQRPPSQL
jgi:hypothetical protein